MKLGIVAHRPNFINCYFTIYVHKTVWLLNILTFSEYESACDFMNVHTKMV